MKNNQYWAIIPAAGIGKRMQADKPKQYLRLIEKTVLEHTLDKLLSLDEITGVVLSINKDDEYWPTLNYKNIKPVFIATGGIERSDSVYNSIERLQEIVGLTEDVHVLVHDAARPCVRAEDIQKLIKLTANSDDGGLLALPVRDTMKRTQDNNQIDKTVKREGLWHALTPQMFRLDILLQALNNAKKLNQSITDDASAMELFGFSPLLIEGHEDNIKITRPFDLTLAEIFIKNQQAE